MSIEQSTKIDERFFAELYEQFWKELYLYCDSFVKDSELAKELVQDVFIGLWENRNKLIIRNSYRNYLIRAVKLKVFEHYRKQAVRDRYLISKQEERVENSLNTEAQVSYGEMKRVLNEIILHLPKKSQEVFLLSRERGMSYKSIATLLSISEKAVEGNISRALFQIRKKLGFNR